MRSSPAVSNGVVFVGSNDGYVYALNTGDGKLLWRFPTDGQVRSSPAVSNDRLFFASTEGRVYAYGSVSCLRQPEWPEFRQNYKNTGVSTARQLFNITKENMTLLWKFTTNGRVTSSPTVADIDGNGRMEIVFGSDDKNLYVLRENGTLLWKFTTNGRVTSSPTVADIDGNGRMEIVFGSWDGNLYVLTGNGNRIFTYSVKSPIESSPAIGDINGDQELEIVFGTNNNRLYALNYRRFLVWTYQTVDDVVSSPAVVDINKDGIDEIIIGSCDGKIYCLKYSKFYSENKNLMSGLFPLWSIQTGNDVFMSPAVGDIDRDGKMEIIFGSGDNILYILNSSGFCWWHYKVNGTIKSSPAIGDLDNDGNLEIVIGSDSNDLYVFGVVHQKKDILGEITNKSENVLYYSINNETENKMKFDTPHILDILVEKLYFWKLQ